MIKTNIPVYLASKSPRRKHLLELLNLKFETFSVDLNEEILDGEHPVKTVKRLSEQKLMEARKKISKGIIITADTIVVLEEQIIGKPKDEADAERILKSLSGKTHAVYTGFAVCNTEKNITLIEYEKTLVTFRHLEKEEIVDYIKSGSPMDKAGAYGIQDDFGAVFVRRIDGCYYNVVGLPLTRLYDTLKRVI
ncbi:MAG: Maf family protein [Bacteroidota bacterium]|jgi:septum formation protein|nr:septum formation protein Maf [Ignavibacteria bacterium]MCU7511199.1 septum formation protein Maf [Ignavibacteria bacterium]MCU7518745.1 septum formation protein Maf [Ignavibacteria bacterium]MCU7522852.1 septum formation protein Maf [Ignavibacteria bacterium]